MDALVGVDSWVGEWMGWLWVGSCDVSSVPVACPARVAAVILCVYTAGYIFCGRT